MGNYDKFFDSCVTSPFVLRLRGVPGIKDVIFSPPVTVVFWEDGRKTVVRDEDTPSSWLANIGRHITQRDNDIVRAWKEQGINAAILKRMTGNRHIGVTRKWVESGRCPQWSLHARRRLEVAARRGTDRRWRNGSNRDELQEG